MNTSKTMKKAAAFVMALALAGGAFGVISNSGSRITASAAAAEAVQTFAVTVDSSITGGKVTVDKTSAAAGDTVTAVASPDSGYEFYKLTVNGEQIAVNDQGVHAFEMPAADAVISAEFEAKAEPDFYSVKSPDNGSIRVEVVDEANKVVRITPTADPGYKLAKVLLNGDQAAVNDEGEYLAEFTGTEMVISAEFEKSEEEAFTIADCQNGKLTAELGQDADSSIVTVTPVPDKGYKVDKVICNGDQVAVNDEGRYVIAYEGKTLDLSAEFVKASYSITVGDVKNGTVTVDKQTAAPGEDVLITAVPAKGYKLDKVLMNGDQVAINDKDQHLIAMPDSDITVTAEFIPETAPAKTDAKDDSSPKTGAAIGICAATALAASVMVLLKKKD